MTFDCQLCETYSKEYIGKTEDVYLSQYGRTLAVCLDCAKIVKDHLKSLVKLGRNDPCHCGSKKKYKKCHGR